MWCAARAWEALNVAEVLLGENKRIIGNNGEFLY